MPDVPLYNCDEAYVDSSEVGCKKRRGDNFIEDVDYAHINEAHHILLFKRPGLAEHTLNIIYERRFGRHNSSSYVERFAHHY